MPRRVPIPIDLGHAPFHVRAAQDAGLSEKRLRSHDLARPFSGVRSLTSADATVVDRCRAFMPRIRDGEFFSHLTAAALWDCPLPGRYAPTAKVHVAIPAPNGESRARGVVGHKIKYPKVEVWRRHGLPVSDPATTFIHCATLLGLDDLVAVGDHLILSPRRQALGERRPHTSAAHLFSRVSAYQGPGKRRATEALALMRQGAESRPETLLRLLIRRAGMPEPQLNVDICDHNGIWIARVDMLYPQARLVVEYDGEQHRTDDVVYENDARRHARIRRAGFTELTVRKHGLFRAPEEFLADLADALAAADGSRKAS
ncbi:DUF559 domain-containing protein [Subtercola sp. YIM 133946]|uniref:DUF559 domain-containing protein n=1 Tax=Subtercola sp. YIM 133946 TaxID=3118909 RepID=UPI002F924C25